MRLRELRDDHFVSLHRANQTEKKKMVNKS